jgi:nucleoside phosphorylase
MPTIWCLRKHFSRCRAQQMLTTFPNIHFGLMVGIGGGVPSLPSDIQLGDVVGGKPMDQHSGVVQYDFGKTMKDGLFYRLGALNKPPQIILTAMVNLESNHMIQTPRMSELLQLMLEKANTTKLPFAYPSREQGQVFDNKYEHEESAAYCDNCDCRHLLPRTPRTSDNPSVHYGLIESGNQVMEHGLTRDRLANALGILCFEMKAAGLMTNFPCLVIRGICDYAGSHKNKPWQGYAALTAVAYAKALLGFLALGLVDNGGRTNSCWMVLFQRNLRFVGRQP